MPDRLKSILVDDWENVTKNYQIVSLPAKFPAAVILDEYAAQARRKRIRAGSSDSELLDEVMHGMKEYFNKALGRVLLYRFERPQYLDIYKQVESPTSDLAGKTMSDVYGGAHLLRLLGRFRA
jgi:mortality factor 4-like protein 1